MLATHQAIDASVTVEHSDTYRSALNSRCSRIVGTLMVVCIGHDSARCYEGSNDFGKKQFI
jgi:hypothetical protein